MTYTYDSCYTWKWHTLWSWCGTHYGHDVCHGLPPMCRRCPQAVGSGRSRELSGIYVQVRTATHCNTLQRTTTHCNILQRIETHCNTLQHIATECDTLQHIPTHCNTLQHAATYCDTLQHAATHCNTLQHSAIRCNTLGRTALQHTATKTSSTNSEHPLWQPCRNSQKSAVLPFQPVNWGQSWLFRILSSEHLFGRRDIGKRALKSFYTIKSFLTINWISSWL